MQDQILIEYIKILIIQVFNIFFNTDVALFSLYTDLFNFHNLFSSPLSFGGTKNKYCLIFWSCRNADFMWVVLIFHDFKAAIETAILNVDL